LCFAESVPAVCADTRGTCWLQEVRWPGER
jgi:hypothetical protein